MCFLGGRSKRKKKRKFEIDDGRDPRGSPRLGSCPQPVLTEGLRNAGIINLPLSQEPQRNGFPTELLQRKGTNNHSKPEEILAFNVDTPKNFRPFAPPPSNAQLLIDGIIYRPMAYRKPYHDFEHEFLESTDEIPNFTQSLQMSKTISNSRRMSSGSLDWPSHPPPPLTRERSFSLKSSSKHSQSKNIRSESHYQKPSSSTLPRKMSRTDDNDIHCESLDPVMFNSSQHAEKTSKALPYPPIYDYPRPSFSNDQLIHVSRSSIVEIRDLGMGKFGRVILAATTGLSLKDMKLGENNNRSRSLLVAIKKLREDADDLLRETFQNDIRFMSKVKHANVARLLGVCYSSEPFLMMEYMEKGDLKEFLYKQTLVSDTVASLVDNQITPLILLYMAVQIASGMRYLASKKFIHRDLATRNCLVGRDFIVKISDFGMSRNLYESSYYLLQGRVKLPIRWMACESFHGKFSTRSDAWSYGVTLWEIYSLAQSEPYEEMTDEQLINDIFLGDKRKRLERPKSCPHDVYDVMRRCWIHEPNMRGDFEEIYSRLFVIYSQMSSVR